MQLFHTVPAENQTRRQGDTATGSPLPEGELAQGTLVGQGGRYRIDRTLGQGGFGVAYLAHDTRLERPCVVKRLAFHARWNAHERAMATQSFAREAQLLVSLNTPGHPHIPEIYDYLAAERCLVMKYIVGQDLERLLRERGPLPAEEALRYGYAVCSALVYMHSRQPEAAMHRDIKPANILLDAEGRVWLIDFGLAKAMPAAASVGEGYSTSAGTPGFTPLEQWRGHAEPRSDIYALAATLHRLLSGYVPEQSHILALISGAQHLPPLRQLVPTLRPELEQLVLDGLAPLDGRPTAQQFLASLESLLNRPSLPQPPIPAQPPATEGLVGRKAVLARYSEQLQQHGVVFISGPPGVGKTALAAALAVGVADPQRRFWYSFRADEGGEAVAWALAGFLAYGGHDELWRGLQSARLSGGQPPPPPVIFDYLARGLEGQNLLLSFDNVHLVENEPALSAFLERLCRSAQAAALQIVVVSRQLPPFAEDHAVEPLMGLDSRGVHELLLAQGLELSVLNEATLAHLTGGNPQLLLLAADAFRQHSDPARLLERLAESQAIERYLLREVDSRLSSHERDVMAGVSSLLGYPASRDAVGATLDRSGLRRELSDLSARHLLIVQKHEQGVRYSQQELIRTFYYEQLGHHERQALHRRAGTYYEHDEPDLLLAARHFANAGDVARAADLASGDIWAAVNRGQARTLLRLLEQLAGASLDAERQVAVLMACGELQTMLRASAAAQTSFRQALALLDGQPASEGLRRQRAWACRGLGELLQHEAPQEALAWLHGGLQGLDAASFREAGALRLRIGSVLVVLGRYGEAMAELEASLQLLPAHDESLRADALTNLGVAACVRGEVARGKQYYEQALALYQAANNYWKIITIWQNLGIEHWYGGEWYHAAADYSRALELARRLGSLLREVQIELALADLLASQGEFDVALSYLAACRSQALTHAMPEQAALASLNQAQIYLRLGDDASAAEAVGAAQPAITAGDFQWMEPPLQRATALLALRRGDRAAALASAMQAVTIAHTQGAGPEEGQSLRVLAEVRMASGEIERADADFARAIVLLDAGDQYEAARTRAAFAQALNARDPARATALWAEAQAVFTRLGAKHDLELLTKVTG